MIRRWLWTAGWCAALAAASATRTAAAEGPKPLGPPAAVLDADALAAWIDGQFAADWETNHVRPAPAADDAEFLRRVYPRPGRPHPVRGGGAHLPRRRRPRQAPPPGRRPAQQPRYAAHFTNVWRVAAAAGGRHQLPGPLPQAGLRGLAQQQLTKNAGYDQMVRDLLTAPIERAASAAAFGPAGRDDAVGLLPRQGVQAGEPGRRHGPRVPRRQRRVRPVPQPPVRRLEARAVLGLRRLLRRHQGAAAGRLPRCPAARTRTSTS